METSLEHILMNTYKVDMISYLDTHPGYFEEAIQLAIADRQPYSWRAAWLLWSCMEENDPRIQVYVKNIIEVLTAKDDDHQRELLKILLQMKLDEEYEGFLFNICTSLWEKINKKPSVRITALKLIIKIAANHPDLSNEIHFLTQKHYLDQLSPAARRSVARMIKKIVPKSAQ